MPITSYEQWLEWSGAYTMLPYIQSYPLPESGARPAVWQGHGSRRRPVPSSSRAAKTDDTPSLVCTRYRRSEGASPKPW
ncbi:hypothetical protein LJK88_48280 [Paenibacillus sp. P26]|nr:hypothetical protein LJK88_48280 [Paenibacillus sp. P26]UUZ97861.1 hypothetical protein LJK87_40035 [Paenibacillus sp. P25]